MFIPNASASMMPFSCQDRPKRQVGTGTITCNYTDRKTDAWLLITSTGTGSTGIEPDLYVAALVAPDAKAFGF